MKHTKQAEVFTEIVLNVFRLNGILNTQGDNLTNEFDLSSARWKILGAIAMSNNAITVVQIGQLMGQSRQSVQQIVNALIKEGFVVSCDNPNHKRSNLMALSKKGKERYQQLINKQIPWANDASKNIPLDELEVTQRTIQRLVKTLTKD